MSAPVPLELILVCQQTMLRYKFMKQIASAQYSSLSDSVSQRHTSAQRASSRGRVRPCYWLLAASMPRSRIELFPSAGAALPAVLVHRPDAVADQHRVELLVAHFHELHLAARIRQTRGQLVLAVQLLRLRRVEVGLGGVGDSVGEGRAGAVVQRASVLQTAAAAAAAAVDAEHEPVRRPRAHQRHARPVYDRQALGEGGAM